MKKGRNFDFTTISECEKKSITSYTEANKDLMLTGVGNEDIRRKIFSTEDIFSSFELIFFIKSKEMCRHATENL